MKNMYKGNVGINKKDENNGADYQIDMVVV